MQRCFPTASIILLALAPHAGAGITYTLQDRAITASTSFDGGLLTSVAPDFGPFVDIVESVATFPTVGGGTALNRARAGIDCQLDPNKILLNGQLSASGGVSVLAAGGTADEVGNAAVRVSVSFTLDTPMSALLTSLARPSVNPEDAFKIRLRQSGGGGVIFFLDESDPPQDVATTIPLAAGDYSIEYQAELTVGGDELSKDFGFELAIPVPGGTVLFGVAAVLGLPRRR